MKLNRKKADNGGNKTDAAAKFKPNPPELDGVPDLTSLLYLEEGNVIHNLNIRFHNKTVYSSVGMLTFDCWFVVTVVVIELLNSADYLFRKYINFDEPIRIFRFDLRRECYSTV